ncbi:ABC transporter permease subunit [Ilumatobacter sp.]|uniref:carbohydrate ABC transporter permease n=1 Tax=Ilumatobacter sp. TaxID=1967498 RepID=UPI003C6187BF
MTVIDDTEIDATAQPPSRQPAAEPENARNAGFYAQRAFAAIAVLFALFLLVTESKARSTLITVVVAVGASAALWIGANLLFNQVRNHWTRFLTLLYATVTFVITAGLSGNRAIGDNPIDDPIAKFVNRTANGIKSDTLTTESAIAEIVAWLWLPLLLSIGAGCVGFFLSRTDGVVPRLAIGAGGLGVIGAITGVSFNFLARPEFDAVALIAWTALGAGVVTGIGVLRKQELGRPALLGATIGWLLGAFGAPEVGGGPAGWTVVAVTVPAILIGIRAAIQPNLGMRERGLIDNNSRKWIFLAPALTFAFAMLVVPAIATIWLSFKGRDGEQFVRWDNYVNIFQDPNSWDPVAGLQLSIFGLANGTSWILLIAASFLSAIGISLFRKSKERPRGRPGIAILAIVGSLLLLASAINWVTPSLLENVFSFNLFRTSTGRSQLMLLGLIVLAAFIIVGLRQRAQTGHLVELGTPSMGPLIVGLLLVLLAIVTTFRGTIVNNLWWVVVVTLGATAMGLAIAVLADGIRFEKIAKSIIFMPMAISLVGASVIWRFMYVARDSSKEQTGVLNGLWVGLGKLSTGREIASVVIIILLGLVAVALMVKFATRRDTVGIIAAILTPFVAFALMRVVAWVWGGELSGTVQKWIVGLLAVLVFVGLLAAVARQLTVRNWGGVALPAIGALFVGWFVFRYFAVWGGGVGGQEINTVGNVKSSPINFIQESPFNSMFLMVVLIWIQTGFAMVILSAAIKAVPTELIEAAKVDGATESQVFWRVTLPQIAPTIGVVVTTIIVLVMKVYDIVNVMTNGNFETQVLANDMFFQAFQTQNQGQGAALAILIFVSVLPVMVFNIRKMQREN